METSSLRPSHRRHSPKLRPIEHRSRNHLAIGDQPIRLRPCSEPVAGNPCPAPPAITPVAGDPYGLRPRLIKPIAAIPLPVITIPVVVAGHPAGVCASRLGNLLCFRHRLRFGGVNCHCCGLLLRVGRALRYHIRFRRTPGLGYQVGRRPSKKKHGGEENSCELLRFVVA
jgi:hypothetical protein